MKLSNLLPNSLTPEEKLALYTAIKHSIEGSISPHRDIEEYKILTKTAWIYRMLINIDNKKLYKELLTYR